MITGNLKSTYAADEQVFDNRNKKLFFAACILFLVGLGMFANDYVILMACRMGLMLIAVVGLNVVVGYTGQMSLGHAAFVAVGAYTTVVFYHLAGPYFPTGIMTILAFAVAIAISAFVGLIVGLPSLRVKGLYLAVATLAANFIVIFLIEQDLFKPWTGGMVGTDTPTPNLFGWELDTKREMYAMITTIAVLMLLFVQNLLRTRIGRAFIAIRDRDYSAEIMGISLLRYKLLSFAISAGYCGAAGALWAFFFARILPEQFELTLSLQLVAALIVGGMGRTMGPVFGVIIILLVPELIKLGFGGLTGGDASMGKYRAPLQEIAFGLLIIAFLMFEPLGLVAITDRILRAMNRWPFAR